jgi:hypothetical protein
LRSQSFARSSTDTKIAIEGESASGMAGIGGSYSEVWRESPTTTYGRSKGYAGTKETSTSSCESVQHAASAIIS